MKAKFQVVCGHFLPVECVVLYCVCFHFAPFLPLVSEQLSAQYGAVKMLHARVRLVLDYLKAVQSGESAPVSQL